MSAVQISVTQMHVQNEITAAITLKEKDGRHRYIYCIRIITLLYSGWEGKAIVSGVGDSSTVEDFFGPPN